MDVDQLAQAVRFYFNHALAPSTQRTYQSAKNRYLKFCMRGSLSPIPVGENTLCLFVAFLAEEKVAHRSIKSYLSAVRHLQISQGLRDPHIGDMSHLEQVLKGIKSTQAKRGLKPKPRLPITPEVLRKLQSVWASEAESFDHVMLWAASVVCFFGFFRAGELTVPSDAAYDPTTHLNFEDIAVDSLTRPSLLQVCLKVSKTDPFRKGVDVFIGPSGDDLCPVKAMAAYLVARGGRAGMLFHFRDGRLLTRESRICLQNPAGHGAGWPEL